MLKLRGTVVEKLKVESGVSKAGKEWSKQDFVIMGEGQYPKPVCFTLFGDKKDLIAKIDKDEVVDVQFNVESREFNGKWFHNLNAYAVDVVLEPANTPPPTGGSGPNAPEEDDLPF